MITAQDRQHIADSISHRREQMIFDAEAAQAVSMVNRHHNPEIISYKPETVEAEPEEPETDDFAQRAYTAIQWAVAVICFYGTLIVLDVVRMCLR